MRRTCKKLQACREHLSNMPRRLLHQLVMRAVHSQAPFQVTRLKRCVAGSQTIVDAAEPKLPQTAVLIRKRLVRFLNLDAKLRRAVLNTMSNPMLAYENKTFLRTQRGSLSNKAYDVKQAQIHLARVLK